MALGIFVLRRGIAGGGEGLKASRIRVTTGCLSWQTVRVPPTSLQPCEIWGRVGYSLDCAASSCLPRVRLDHACPRFHIVNDHIQRLPRPEKLYI